MFTFKDTLSNKGLKTWFGVRNLKILIVLLKFSRFMKSFICSEEIFLIILDWPFHYTVICGSSESYYLWYNTIKNECNDGGKSAIIIEYIFYIFLDFKTILKLFRKFKI